MLGANRVIDAVIAVGFRPPPRPLDLEFDQPGAMARHLSDHTHGSPLDPVWDEWAADARDRECARQAAAATASAVAAAGAR